MFEVHTKIFLKYFLWILKNILSVIISLKVRWCQAQLLDFHIPPSYMKDNLDR